MHEPTSFVLASASSRRAELLSYLLKDFKKQAANIDESLRQNESASGFVTRLAKEKAKSVLSSNKDAYVLGSDTIVVVGDVVLGKPNNLQHSKDMLTLLSGGWHQVMTAVSIQYYDQMQQIAELSCLVITHVEFCHLSDEEIVEYWHTQEPQDKAGSYAIQGIGGQFIKQIRGSYSAVVGLPLVETKLLLTQIGIVS